MSKEIKEYKVCLKVKCSQNTNKNLPKNAVAIVRNAIIDAMTFNIQNGRLSKDKNYIKYLDEKIKCYAEILNSIDIYT